MLFRNEVKAMDEFIIDSSTYIERVVLKVQDLHRQIAFYEKVIGLSTIERTNQMALLGVDGENALIELVKTAEKEQPAKGTGLYHLALLLPNRTAFATKLFEVLRNKVTIDSPLEQKGRFPHFERILPIARLDSASDHGYSEAVYLYDIEGNGIEIYADRPEEQWKKYLAGSHPLNFKELAPLADDETIGKLPLGTRIGHVHLRVDRIKESLEFYVDTLGFEKQELMSDVFFVSAGGYHHHFAGNIWSGENNAQPLDIHTGLERVVVKITSEEAFSELKNHIKQLVPFQDKGQSIIVTDPSGNKIEFTI